MVRTNPNGISNAPRLLYDVFIGEDMDTAPLFYGSQRKGFQIEKLAIGANPSNDGFDTYIFRRQTRQLNHSPQWYGGTA